MEKRLTKEQVNKKYKGKYIEFATIYNYLGRREAPEYVVTRVYKQLHENSTLGEDVGTEWEYRR